MAGQQVELTANAEGTEGFLVIQEQAVVVAIGADVGGAALRVAHRRIAVQGLGRGV